MTRLEFDLQIIIDKFAKAPHNSSALQSSRQDWGPAPTCCSLRNTWNSWHGNKGSNQLLVLSCDEPQKHQPRSKCTMQLYPQPLCIVVRLYRKHHKHLKCFDVRFLWSLIGIKWQDRVVASLDDVDRASMQVMILLWSCFDQKGLHQIWMQPMGLSHQSQRMQEGLNISTYRCILPVSPPPHSLSPCVYLQRRSFSLV